MSSTFVNKPPLGRSARAGRRFLKIALGLQPGVGGGKESEMVLIEKKGEPSPEIMRIQLTKGNRKYFYISYFVPRFNNNFSSHSNHEGKQSPGTDYKQIYP